MKTLSTSRRRQPRTRLPIVTVFLLAGWWTPGTTQGRIQDALPVSTPIPVSSPTPGTSPSPTPTFEPTATPGSSISPEPSPVASVSPSPVPSVSPTGAPGAVVTSGLTDLVAYTQARTPSASVSLISTGDTPIAAVQSGATKAVGMHHQAANGKTTMNLQPTVLGGLFSEINLGVLNGNNLPPAAKITLQFDALRAGSLVWVQTLDGGTLSAVGADGAVTNLGGFLEEINAAGQIEFTFQAPAASARYQVYVRLDNIATVLPLIVTAPPDKD